jgi:fibronectin type III domain protein
MAMRPCFFSESVIALVCRWILGIHLGLAGCGSDENISGVEPAGATKTLSWTAVPDSSVLGYKVYWGTTSHQYDSHADVGSAASYTLSGLTSGTTYYFAVSAYRVGGESALSTEASAFVDWRKSEWAGNFKLLRSDS